MLPAKHHQIETVNIVKMIVLTIFTFGIYFFFWQKKQFKQFTILLENEDHTFWKWFFLSFITFGFYHVYHENQASNEILAIQKKYGLKEGPEYFALVCLGLSVTGMFLITDILHQEEINKTIIALKKR